MKTIPVKKSVFLILLIRFNSSSCKPPSQGVVFIFPLLLWSSAFSRQILWHIYPWSHFQEFLLWMDEDGLRAHSSRTWMLESELLFYLLMYIVGFRPNCLTCIAHLYLYYTLLVPHTYASYIRHWCIFFYSRNTIQSSSIYNNI